MYKILFTKEASKYYKKCDNKTKRLLNECIKDIENDPFGGSSIKRLHGELEGLFRYRVGGLRVIYRPDKEEVIVIIIAIGSRGDIY